MLGDININLLVRVTSKRHLYGLTKNYLHYKKYINEFIFLIFLK